MPGVPSSAAAAVHRESAPKTLGYQSFRRLGRLVARGPSSGANPVEPLTLDDLLVDPSRMTGISE
ncbi:MAG: hypothetical protein OER88_01880, partial [Planctomycetota bacterium]|nr:hypothetical protein [Planctomycetota bacterium]